MEVFKEINPLKSYLKTFRSKGKQIGLVPTMGALHEGHLTLVEKSNQENDLTVCSIYVNPTQFNNKGDLSNYPRELENDLKLLKQNGCDVVFVPSDEVMYPNPVKMKLSFGHLETTMEGAFRPGHFTGVGIIVSKLFNITEPDRAYFGQKDLQQFLVIKQLVSDMAFDVELRCVEIIREDDGLAKSSRNLRLSAEDRKKSIILLQALQRGKSLLLNGGTVETCKLEVSQMMDIPNVSLEYFEVVEANNLTPLTNISDNINVALCVAAFVGEVRLIDNIIFRSKKE
ncbi:MAG: pantoate--beta-alanine ligase [Fulvivirga sp.]